MAVETRRFSELMTPQRANERCLIVVAAPAEARAILAGFGRSTVVPGEWEPVSLRDNFELLLSGVGKANAAGATARAIGRVSPTHVLNLGVCGALPHAKPLAVGQSVLASRCVLADEGIETQTDWIPLAKAGFPAGIDTDWISPSTMFNETLRSLADRIGVIATVSSCSGTDARAKTIAERCGAEALAEAMEGAAIGLGAARQNIPFAELRVVSNRTGNRESQGWDIPKALARLEVIASQIAARSVRDSAG